MSENIFTLGIDFGISLSSKISKFKQNNIYKAISSDKEFCQYMGILNLNETKQFIAEKVFVLFVNKSIELEVVTSNSSILLSVSDFFINSCSVSNTYNVHSLTDDTQLLVFF